MKPFTLLVKPACGDCNLRCEYCFYLGKRSLYPDSARHRMSTEVLEQMIKTYMATEQPVYSIGWQGGEPTLMGVDFFRKVTEFQQKYGRPGASVANGLQTNATLIDDEMAAHFGKYHFLAGCSLDGPPELHDKYRKTADGQPTHARVMSGIEALKSNNVEFNILTLVSEANIKHAAEVYHYLTDTGFLFQQYIPCVEFDENGQLLPYAITGRQWGEFMCAIFDEWRKQDTHRVSVRHFDSIVLNMVEGTTNVCVMGRNCCQYFVVEHNGDIYPCDFFVEPDLKLGNVMDTSWEEAQKSPVYRSFGAQKARWNSECRNCPHLDLCAADCIKHRNYAENAPQNISWLCEGWKMFYSHTRRHFEELAREVKTRRDREMQIERAAAMRKSGRVPGPVSRNMPCPCGSGKKYKKCCGR